MNFACRFFLVLISMLLVPFAVLSNEGDGPEPHPAFNPYDSLGNSGKVRASGPPGQLRHLEGIDAEPFPVPLTPKQPLGSLIYDPGVAGTIGDEVEVDADDFETGVLGPQWGTFSSTPNGSIQVTEAFGAADGSLALLMDTNLSGPTNLNEAIWTVDLSGVADATLRFFHADFNDEDDPLPPDFIGSFNGDGVAISDNGSDWHTVLNATSVPFGTWQEVLVDLDAAAAAAGMTLGPNFQIKFQQFDNFPLTTDGRGYDGISVTTVDPGDTDSFTIDVDPGQTITVVAETGSSLQASVELISDADGGVIVAAGTAAAPGEDVVLQTVPTAGRLAGNGPGARPYRLEVSGANNTVGDYVLNVILNAAVEDEGHGGPPNDSLGTAQDIEASFLPLHNSIDDSTDDRNPNRGAVLGQIEGPGVAVIDQDDFETGALGPQWTTVSSTPNGRIQVTDAFGAADGSLALLMDTNLSGPTNLNEAIWTVDLSGVADATLRFFHADFNDEDDPLPPDFIGSFNGDGVAISDNGSDWHTVLNATSVPFGTWQEVVVDLDAAAAAAGMTFGPNFQIKFQQFDNFPLTADGRGYDGISISIDVPGHDWYAFGLEAGDSTTLALTAQGGDNLQLALFDAAGNLVANTFADDLIENGSFESGDFTGWTTTTTGTPFRPWAVTGAGLGGGFGLAQTEPQDEAFVAWNGFDGGGPMEFTLFQDVSIPADFVAATLQWQDRLQWNFTLGGFASLPRLYDVELRDPATNALLATLFSFSTGDQATNPTGDTGWQSHSVDLSAFAGTTVRLIFREQIPQASTGPGQVEVDGIRLVQGDRATNVDAVISNFLSPATGTYFARVESGAQTDYSLVVTRNADFGLDVAESAQPVESTPAAGRQWILGHVGGGTLYASTREGELLRLDPNSGVGALVGALPNDATEIEFDNATGRAFVQFPDGFFAGQEFDIATGAGIGAPVFNGAAFNGLEYVNSTLYGTAILSPGGPSTLRTLDPFAGASTIIGPTGVGPISGLAYDAAAGTMYGIAGGGGPADFYTIDLGTGAATVVGNAGFQAGSLQFGPDRLLYGGGTGPDEGNLYRVDPATGAGTLVGATGFGRLTGLTLVAGLASDFYVVNLGRGKPLEVEAFLPATATGEFLNQLDPVIRLYDASGNLVASNGGGLGNQNVRLRFKAPKGGEGTYLIEVMSTANGNGPTGGEYLLGIKGNTSP